MIRHPERSPTWAWRCRTRVSQTWPDRSRNLLYGDEFPAWPTQFQIATGETRDLGRIANWDSIPRALVLDDSQEGIRRSVARNRVFRYDPESDRDRIAAHATASPDHLAVRPRAARRAQRSGGPRSTTRGTGRSASHAGAPTRSGVCTDTGMARLLVLRMCPDEFVGKDEVPYASALALGPGQ